MPTTIVKALVVAFALVALLGPAPARAASDYQYQLYKNLESFGIVVFPKQAIFPELAQYLQTIGFVPAESGDAVMRSGTRNRNQTYMMPLEVQKKHAIEKFIILQVLTDQDLLVGIYDPEWGLTLPRARYVMDEIRKNIPTTLDLFRGKGKREGTPRELPPGGTGISIWR